VAEWLKAPHSKCGIRATVSGVQIPPSPPGALKNNELFAGFVTLINPFESALAHFCHKAARNGDIQKTKELVAGSNPPRWIPIPE
jgi:hypothetical protein